LLSRTLASLSTQTFAPSAYEVIVVSDGDDPATQTAVAIVAAQQAPRGLRIRLIVNPVPRGPAAARNAGWRAACGGIIAFTDDDCVPDPHWVSRGTSAMGSGVAAVTGRTIVPLPPSPTDYERDAAGLAQAEFITANCFVRRTMLEAVGGFDERFPMAWREDSDLQFAILEHGGRIIRDAGAVVTHPLRPGRWGISIRQQRRSFYNALLYKKHPALYRSRIQSAPPWQYYAGTAALMAACGAVVLRRPRAAAAAGAVWGIFWAELCGRRLRGAARTPRHVGEMFVTSAFIPPCSIFWRLAGAVRFRVPFL
jgi:glycosyltransferase involved in cell wall biosynthesis